MKTPEEALLKEMQAKHRVKPIESEPKMALEIIIERLERIRPDTPDIDFSKPPRLPRAECTHPV